MSLWTAAAAWLAENKLAAGAVLIGAALVFFLWMHFSRREKELFSRLNRMLDEAVAGNYEESSYDESLMSSAESRMVQFLNRSSRSEERIREERDKIKTLISDIAHQTRTPVANLRLYTELLQETELTAEGREYAGALVQQTEKLEFLIQSLIKMSRLETGLLQVKPAPGPVSALISQVWEQALPAARRKGVTLLAETGNDSLTASFDMVWTVEALYNLVDNGVKYTPCGGKVVIRAEKLEMFCRIDVADNGMGISEEEQGQIFSRFYRSADAAETEGMGLGLYLARKIAAAQGGYIRVRSRWGAGTVFSLYLQTVRTAEGGMMQRAETRR